MKPLPSLPKGEGLTNSLNIHNRIITSRWSVTLGSKFSNSTLPPLHKGRRNFNKKVKKAKISNIFILLLHMITLEGAL